MGQGYAIADKVTHTGYGFATVTFVGAEYIGPRFEADGGHALFRKGDEGIQRGWDASLLTEETLEEETRPLPWPDSTFVQEPADAQHYMGSHWEPFFDDVRSALFQQLPTIVPEASPLQRASGVDEACRAEPADWATGGRHLVWPGQDANLGLVMTLQLGEQANQLVSIYPYVAAGTPVTVALDRVRVWEGGLEAQVDALWGEARVTFFDTAFLLNRRCYERGAHLEFSLAGIAYDAGPAETMRMPYTPNPDQSAWERMLAEERGDPPPEVPEYIDLAGAAFFVEIPEWDADDYNFRGAIQAVEPFEDYLGQAGWKVRVTVMRFGEVDADLDIHVTRRAWDGEEPPREGQNIDGRLWLQGRLWSAPPACTVVKPVPESADGEPGERH